MKLNSLLLAACLLAGTMLTACQEEYDDTALWEAVNDHEERLAALEQWQQETNTNIQSLQTLLSTTDYITDVTPITENGVEIGYVISFLHNPAITIYHGEKGDKGEQGEQGEQGIAGSTPQISVTQGEDGNWYWTLNGDLLLDEVTSIGDAAFRNCTTLSSITLPAGIENISTWAFANCNALSTVTCQAETPPTISSAVFYGCDLNLSIQVPANSVNTYKTTDGWSEYADKITEISAE